MSAKKRVLIVEDDMIISLVVENMVAQLGHEVVGKAVSGEDAVGIAKKEKPDLLLIDIRLKGLMDGIDTVKEIKNHIDASVIYLTGNSDKLNYERAKETNFVELIIKPFTLNDISRAIALI